MTIYTVIKNNSFLANNIHVPVCLILFHHHPTLQPIKSMLKHNNKPTISFLINMKQTGEHLMVIFSSTVVDVIHLGKQVYTANWACMLTCALDAGSSRSSPAGHQSSSGDEQRWEHSVAPCRWCPAPPRRSGRSCWARKCRECRPCGVIRNRSLGLTDKGKDLETVVGLDPGNLSFRSQEQRTKYASFTVLFH